MKLTFLTILLCLGLAACGGSSGSNGGTTTGGTGGGTGGGTSNPPAASPPGSATVVAAGATGVNITVPGPSQNPTPNAQLLGVLNPTTGRATVTNTGDVIQRGTTPDVLISGPGISATSTVRISGPGDITITDQGGIQDSTGTIPGVRVTLNVPGNAVPGLRTVFIINGNDMTTFTGGLEVQ